MNTTSSEKTSTRIREYLKDKNLTVNAFSNRAGLSQASVNSIVHGHTKTPSAEILSSIAREMGCSLDYLVGLTDDDYGPVGFTSLRRTFPSFEDPDCDPLRIECTKFAGKFFSKTDAKGGDVWQAALDLYDYTMQEQQGSKRPKLNTKFAKWHCERLEAARQANKKVNR